MSLQREIRRFQESSNLDEEEMIKRMQSNNAQQINRDLSVFRVSKDEKSIKGEEE